MTSAKGDRKGRTFETDRMAMKHFLSPFAPFLFLYNSKISPSPPPPHNMYSISYFLPPPIPSTAPFLSSPSNLLFTVLSAGLSVFVHWKVAVRVQVHRVHNLRLCTGFLFPVYSRSYYGLYTVSFITYPCMYCTFPVVIFVHRNIAAYLPEFRCLQCIQWSYYSISSAFFNMQNL